jgi:hypothetical protein
MSKHQPTAEIIKDKVGNPQAVIRTIAGGSQVLCDLSGSSVATYNSERDKTLDVGGNVAGNKNRLLSLIPLR